jgi:hypothetical protein
MGQLVVNRIQTEYKMCRFKTRHNSTYTHVWKNVVHIEGFLVPLRTNLGQDPQTLRSEKFPRFRIHAIDEI